jgi:hypothetical protein
MTNITTKMLKASSVPRCSVTQKRQSLTVDL